VYYSTNAIASLSSVPPLVLRAFAAIQPSSNNTGYGLLFHFVVAEIETRDHAVRELLNSVTLNTQPHDTCGDGVLLERRNTSLSPLTRPRYPPCITIAPCWEQRYSLEVALKVAPYAKKLRKCGLPIKGLSIMMKLLATVAVAALALSSPVFAQSATPMVSGPGVTCAPSTASTTSTNTTASTTAPTSSTMALGADNQVTAEAARMGLTVRPILPSSAR
jgi:hypothetical protein